MKKLLESILVLGITFSLLGAGTFSYFIDTEISIGITFTADNYKYNILLISL